jgi:hypothetical protein
MIKYVLLISLIFALLCYILAMIILDIKSKGYFTINYIFGYFLMFLNFLYLSKRIMKMQKINIFFYTYFIRFFILSLLLFLWIRYGKLNIMGLFGGLVTFTLAIPISAFIYIKLGENNGTSH